MMSPVIHLASSEARNTATGPMSSGVPRRPRGVAAIRPVEHIAADQVQRAGAFGVGRAWSDGVDSDLAGGNLVGENLGESRLSALGRCIEGRTRIIGRDAGGRDDDDRTAVGTDLPEVLLDDED